MHEWDVDIGECYPFLRSTPRFALAGVLLPVPRSLRGDAPTTTCARVETLHCSSRAYLSGCNVSTIQVSRLSSSSRRCSNSIEAAFVSPCQCCHSEPLDYARDRRSEESRFPASMVQACQKRDPSSPMTLLKCDPQRRGTLCPVFSGMLFPYRIAIRKIAANDDGPWVIEGQPWPESRASGRRRNTSRASSKGLT